MDLNEFLSSVDVTEINHVEVVQKVIQEIQNRNIFYYDNLLPLLFNIRGKPLTLRNHFPMRSIFARVLPEQLTYKTGRQISKSVSNAIQSIFIAGTTPYYNILHITPLFEMIRKFSTNYVKAFVDDSPLKGMFVTKSSSRSVLQQSFRNGSNLIFTFAFNDCTRVRGNTANTIKYDEYQNMDPSFEPIINQTISAVNAGIDASEFNAYKNVNRPCIMRFGTPLTLENGLEQMWELSSQAEWAIQCRNPSCRHINIPSLREDLEKMLGPRERKEKVTPATPGLVCAKCGGYLYTRDGRWMHNFPERREFHAGYHIPQCIMPFHCEDNANWLELQKGRFNRNVMSQAEFYNESCGESFDHGQKLISVTDLRNAATLPHKHERDLHLKNINAGRYLYWGIGIDWGGGGASGISKTAFAFAGLRSDGIVEVFSGYRSNTPNDFNLEASRARDMFRYYRCTFMAMDFHGSGNRQRYDKMLEFGIPKQKVIPISYLRVGNGAIARWIRDDLKERIPQHVQMNKTRSFLLLSHLIRAGKVRFFQYDYIDKERPGLLRDFTALAEDKVKMKHKGEVYYITQVPQAGPDDFADAVNYAVAGLYIVHGQWPDTGAITSIADLTPEQQKMIDPKFQDMNFDWYSEEDQ
jgi:hypothetical protein